jgi:hypothetical protein
VAGSKARRQAHLRALLPRPVELRRPRRVVRAEVAAVVVLLPQVAEVLHQSISRDTGSPS